MRTLSKAFVLVLVSVMAVVPWSGARAGEADTVPAPAPAEFLLGNPCFEEGSSRWERVGTAAHIAVHEWQKHEGKSSFGVGNDNGPDDAWGGACQTVEIPGGIREGDPFLFGAWVHTEPRYTGEASLVLEFADAGGQTLAAFESEPLTGEFDWTNVAVLGAAPAGAQRVTVKCMSRNMAPGKSLSFVWFDSTSFDAPVITASSVLPGGFDAANVAKAGTWHSARSDKQWITMDARAGRTCTGIFIDWDEDYAEDYAVQASDDGETWDTLYTARKEQAGPDAIYLEGTRARFLRLDCRTSATGNGFGIRAIRMMGPGEVVTLQKYYAIIAENSPALYPRWLTRQEAYWTGVGVIDDDNEAILCEDGTIEPHKRQFTIMPFLRVDGKLVTRDDGELDQSLEQNCLPLPTVTWKYDGLEVTVTLFASGEVGESIAYAWYRMANHREEDVSASLLLTLRPFQIYPPWQGGGGFATNKSIAYADNVVTINDEHRVFPLTEPTAFGAMAGSEHIRFPFKVPGPPEPGGDVTALLLEDVLPEATSAEDPEGFASAVLAYDFELAPGADDEVFLAIPLHETMPDLSTDMDQAEIEAAFRSMLDENIELWASVVDTVKIDIPEQAMVDMLKANIAHSLVTKDGPAFEPGSRSYDKAWMRDGGMAATALLKMGRPAEVRAFIDWYTPFQLESGEVPPIIDTKAEDPLWEEKENGLIEYDSQGEFVYTILEYYRFTKDRAFLEGKLDHVVKALEFLVHLRSQTMTAEFENGPPEKRKYYGILPPSTSHEGYGREYSYWDDFWALKGWKDGRMIFAVLGRDDLVEWADKEYADFKKCFYDSVRLTMELAGIDFIPGSASLADFDATSTAVAVMYCDELVNLPQPALKNTFDRYYEDLRSRHEPDAVWRIVPYELRTVPAFLYMGEKERALELLRFMMDCRRPTGWNQLAEVVHSDYRFPTYVGDMPHTWVGAEYMNGFRSVFLYETEGRLVLGHGIDEAWLESERGVSVENMPTYYGTINYTMRREGDTLKARIWGEASPPPRGFVLKVPQPDKTRQVTLNEETWEAFSGEEIVFTALPADLVITYRE